MHFDQTKHTVFFEHLKLQGAIRQAVKGAMPQSSTILGDYIRDIIFSVELKDFFWGF